MSYYTNAKNPYTNLIDRPYVLWSASQGGASSSDYRLGSTDVTIPAAPNYPPSESGASTSYFIFTKWDFYKTSTNSTQFYLYNETQGKIINVVDQDATLSNYTGKFMGQGSEKRNVIECHVGTTSNQASDVISYKAVVSGSVFDAYEINNFEVGSLTVVSTGLSNIAGDVKINGYTQLQLPLYMQFTSTSINSRQLYSVNNTNISITDNLYTTHASGYKKFSINKISSDANSNDFFIFDAWQTGGDLTSTKYLIKFQTGGNDRFYIMGDGGIKMYIHTITSDLKTSNFSAEFGNSSSVGAGFIGCFTTGLGISLAISDGTSYGWYIFTGAQSSWTT